MNRLLAVYRFELKRILTPGRSLWWFLVVAFPVSITFLMESVFPHARGAPQEDIDTVFTIALYFLGPSIACMLGALLTAAPSVASELEQHSWIYFATRPNGLFHLVMGKFLMAVTWTASAAVLGVLLSLPISRIERVGEVGSALVLVALLSSVGYSALYTMIGTLFPQRAMVFCVAYTAAVELFMGTIPAIINRLTVQYRLRTFLYHRLSQGDKPDTFGISRFIAADEGVVLQLLWSATLCAIFLSVALATVQVREFTAAQETDV